jgi:hypothetical protein
MIWLDRAAMATLTRSFSPSLRIVGKAGTITIATMRTYDGDDADAVDVMIKRSPAATDDELAQRYTDYSAERYAILREPNVWCAIERVAAKLMERGKLSAAEALEAIGGDAARLHP